MSKRLEQIDNEVVLCLWKRHNTSDSLDQSLAINESVLFKMCWIVFYKSTKKQTNRYGNDSFAINESVLFINYMLKRLEQIDNEVVLSLWKRYNTSDSVARSLAINENVLFKNYKLKRLEQIDNEAILSLQNGIALLIL